MSIPSEENRLAAGNRPPEMTESGLVPSRRSPATLLSKPQEFLKANVARADRHACGDWRWLSEP